MYLLTVYPEGFKSLVIRGDESYVNYDCLRWSGKSKINTWKKPPLEWLDDDLTEESDQVGDFIAFGGGRIALSKRAYSLLSKHLGEQAEFLPTLGPDSIEEWRLLNVLNVLDIMDSSKSKYEIFNDGEVGDCSHAFLNTPPKENHIFLVDGYFPDIFIDKSTKDLIENSSLTGALIREYKNP